MDEELFPEDIIEIDATALPLEPFVEDGFVRAMISEDEAVSMSWMDALYLAAILTLLSQEAAAQVDADAETWKKVFYEMRQKASEFVESMEECSCEEPEEG